ncbi:Asp-tRNA(Asn)/Glu-tRNA(Gln) amidotransferase subunit GatB [Tropheryma whipplei]|uniref:Aspartyl/glutamyl-tRNA(Asn/Gln) amidotransferase subunit B n=1 Tax=Tropheryma whipplei (strain Twist) TaxID=203267 RepID=GATB_TROWT|nr:Asp-tRNA(Asn)/Glu-tRNA(Gln) amidotransferase subunit GatB [Tropheryma whipplei]Q83GA2.1 RecName: Full=Aspartyl/glutamyl-tRNA(Asn/Gln) amidotransferase subunit B; Short=Asp/Glu-ADT subunit B [Tropheryma whipplei str. Twist]AAO44508.1 glutamyl-tRNA(Gln) amidotransferase subunit B [Tropheryma whipplei str. Twist]
MSEVVTYEDALKDFEPIIGLEVHVELSTQTKLFSSAPNIAGPLASCASQGPNTLVTPVCLGLPGSLPTVNERAVDYGIALGLALGCSIADELIFARKNYFYPDLPKNYQISQFDSPLAYDGKLEVETESGDVFFVEIERAHLEEDAGKLAHKSSTGRIQGAQYSLIDYNRSGVPLVEIVSRPVFADRCAPQVARVFVELIREIVLSLGVSNARLERGNIRCDANVSLRPRGLGAGILPNRTETKNLNSLRSIERAIRYEIQRQATLISSGELVRQETRHWREDRGITLSGRVKADSHEYRYFPEPDLLPIPIPSDKVEAIRLSMPEHPLALRRRLKAEWKFSDLQFRDVLNSSVLKQVDETVRAGATPDGAKKWWTGEITRIASQRRCNASDLISPEAVAEIELLISKGILNDSLARKVLAAVIDESLSVQQAIEKYDLSLTESASVERVLEKVLSENQEVVQKVISGKTQAVGVLVGSCMKALGGKADASKLRQTILNRLLPR